MLIVGWFKDFKVPVVMLAAISLSIIGIVFGHWMLGAYFTATRKGAVKSSDYTNSKQL